MCMLGKRTPHTKEPMKKRTIILTNDKSIIQSLSTCKCDHSPLHIRCQGSEKGVQLCAWAQIYPRNLCEIIARAALTSATNS